MTDIPLTLESMIEELLRRMGFDPRVTVREVGQMLTADVELREGSGALIGRGGEGIDALEEITRRLIRRRFGEVPRVALDVNGYRRELATALREHARDIAEQVKRSGATYSFNPMHARERRIVHLELATRADVITESVGEGPARHVVVRPAP